VILFLENKSIPNPSFDKGREQRDFSFRSPLFQMGFMGFMKKRNLFLHGPKARTNLYFNEIILPVKENINLE
jgi:hypothetical protein